MMSELDKFFGPKADRPATQCACGSRDNPDLATGQPPARLTPDELIAAALQGGTRWHCEDRIKTTLDAFFECYPELIPRSPGFRTTHYVAARFIVDELGETESPAFIRWAATVVQREHPTLPVKTCRSLAWLVGDWRKREAPDPAKWWTRPCPKCFTLHHPDGACNGEESEDD